MNRLKRLLALLLTLLLACTSLFGCGIIDQETAVQLAEQVLIAALEAQQEQQDQQAASAPTAAPNATAAPKVESATQAPTDEPDHSDDDDASVTCGEWYDTPEEVAEYRYLYDELPPNFITKDEARDLGWDNSRGNLWDVAPGMSIGGDYFGNYEGQLPEEKGRRWTECDVNYDGGYRGPERIVFSNDGLIYYTADHYEHFTLLYGEE